ncbi:hypothetical protein CGRA01v4_09050 [Colletotrichum graminicola]|nr:hypothetical protein CGRA01v4_09050 [Colletotrichum graminicola]
MSRSVCLESFCFLLRNHSVFLSFFCFSRRLVILSFPPVCVYSASVVSPLCIDFLFSSHTLSFFC